MTRAKVGVVVFPGTNCNIETVRALEVVGFDAIPVWYED